MRPNLLLTGLPRVGKTTLVLSVLASLPPAATCGFITRELRRDGRRVGFAVETLAGESCVLAHVDIRSRYQVSRYRVDLIAFETLALPAIDPAQATAPLIVIDEIGKMECFSTGFRELVLAAVESDRGVLATIALRGDRFIKRLKVHPEVTLLSVTKQNRNELVAQVVNWAQEVLARA
jgi:nucleoside-triphosphatase